MSEDAGLRQILPKPEGKGTLMAMSVFVRTGIPGQGKQNKDRTICLPPLPKVCSQQGKSEQQGQGGSFLTMFSHKPGWRSGPAVPWHVCATRAQGTFLLSALAQSAWPLQRILQPENIRTPSCAGLKIPVKNTNITAERTGQARAPGGTVRKMQTLRCTEGRMIKYYKILPSVGILSRIPL